MDVLEPSLIIGITHLIAVADTYEVEEIDLDLAFNEGALLIAIRADLALVNRTAFADSNNLFTVALTDSDTPLATQAAAVSSMGSLAALTIGEQIILETAASGALGYYDMPYDWRSIVPGAEGFVVTRNPFFQFRNPGTLTMAAALLYKRVRLSDSELVRFVSLRGRA